MSAARALLGPVLSFRGCEGSSWKVTALVGVAEAAPPPEFHFDGIACAAPMELLVHQKIRYLRFDLTCACGPAERRVHYGVRGGPAWSFTVPAAGMAPRCAYVSCNGFSDPSGIRKLVRPADAAWSDLLANHDKGFRAAGYLLDKEQLWHEIHVHDKGVQRFHLLLMGGDQIYFDSIWEEIEDLRTWVSLSREKQLAFKVTQRLRSAIENYYFGLYAKRWLPKGRKPWGGPPNADAADALATAPTVMMWDDHDIFDGWGSYSCEMQHCELFRTLFDCARKAFWVFQLQHRLQDLPELRPLSRPHVSLRDPQLQAIDWNLALDTDPLRLPILQGQPGFTYAFRMAALSMVVVDLRTERSRTQVLGSSTWTAIQSWLDALTDHDPAQQRCEHLFFLSSVPVADPKLTLAEALLDTFGHDHVTDSNADDLRDHWAHDDHEGERKRLLETLAQVAETGLLRISILSGDVHVAAWATAYRKDIPPGENWAQIHQFTSSAVVHPSMVGVYERIFLKMLNQAASQPQSIDVQHTVEMMIFPGHNRYVMPARNWLALELDEQPTESGRRLWATWRCEGQGAFSNHLHAVHPARTSVVAITN